MAVPIGIEGDVTSWTNNTRLVSSGAEPARCSLSIASDTIDSTGFSSSNRAVFPGLDSWSGSFTTRLSAADIGSRGLVAWTSISYYAVNIRDWQLSITAPSLDITAFSSGSPPSWRLFRPGLMSWSGAYNGYLDTSTSVTAPATADDSTRLGSLTLTLRDDPMTFAGSAMISEVGIEMTPSDRNQVTHTFEGSGALTAAGNAFFTAGTVAPLTSYATDEMVITSSSGKTYTGDAFWTSVQITCTVDGIIETQVQFQGTGALVIA